MTDAEAGPMRSLEQQIELRRPRYEDLGALHAAVTASVPELTRWLGWCVPEYSLNEAADWLSSRTRMWEEGTEYDFVITDLDSGEILGVCGLNNIQRLNNLTNLGYWVRTNWTRQGIATAAVRMVARFALDTLQFGRVEIIAAVDNLASQRVAEKAGATREGVLRCRTVVRERVYDAAIFSFTKEDLAKLSSPDGGKLRDV
jgi:ribosomal-protein-serine acetyltransferase